MGGLIEKQATFADGNFLVAQQPLKVHAGEIGVEWYGISALETICRDISRLLFYLSKETGKSRVAP